MIEFRTNKPEFKFLVNGQEEKIKEWLKDEKAK